MDRYNALAICLTIGFFISAGALGYILTDGFKPDTFTTTKTDKIFIASLKTTEGVSGSFVLGTGYFNTGFKYAYYEMLPGGGFQLKTIDVSRTTVFQDEDISPYLLDTYDIEINRHTNLTTIRYASKKYELHVPKNTIEEKFTL